jgi:hypothetical protein
MLVCSYGLFNDTISSSDYNIVTYMRFPWFNNVSSATTMEQYNTCVSLVTQTILGD